MKIYDDRLRGDTHNCDYGLERLEYDGTKGEPRVTVIEGEYLAYKLQWRTIEETEDMWQYINSGVHFLVHGYGKCEVVRLDNASGLSWRVVENDDHYMMDASDNYRIFIKGIDAP